MQTNVATPANSTGLDEVELDDAGAEDNTEEGYDLPSLLQESLVSLESTRLPQTLPKKIATHVTDVIKHDTNDNTTHFDQGRESVVETSTTSRFDEGMRKLCRNVATLVIDRNTEVQRICKSLLLSSFLTKDVRDILLREEYTWKRKYQVEQRKCDTNKRQRRGCERRGELAGASLLEVAVCEFKKPFSNNVNNAIHRK